MTPSQIVHACCGSPRVPSCEDAAGRCWLCAGSHMRGEPVESWSGASFTGQNRVRYPAGMHVCEGCVFVCSRLSPVPGRPPKEGKKLGGNFRNYSMLAEQRGAWTLETASKGEKPRVLSFLSREHSGTWFAAVADSGQKHVIPWAPLNPPGRGGVVLFDEQLVQVPEDLALVQRMAGLLTAGATKAEIERGDYSARSWQLCGVALEDFERESGHERGGAWFALALWLAQRDEEAVQQRMDADKEQKRAAKGKAKNPDRRDGTRTPRRVPADTERQRPQALGPVTEQDPGRGSNLRDPGGVGDAGRATASDRCSEQAQLSLFDGSGARSDRARLRRGVARPGRARDRASDGNGSADRRGKEGTR